MYRLAASLIAVALVASCNSTGSPSAPGVVVPPASQACARTSVGLTPLTEPGQSPYPGTSLGLYPGGGNAMPGDHLSAGLEQANAVTPLDSSGQPDPAGRYALISVGMSNTTQEFQAFIALGPSANSKLAIVDGAQGGQTAANWANPGCACWSTLENRIRQSGLTNAQVVAAWVKLANAQPSGTWPSATMQLREETNAVMRALRTRFRNLRLAYLSSRTYAGYAASTLNPEPYAYQSGFAVRWVIEDQLSGRLPFAGESRVAPWIAWGPYLWADGLTPRGDGLTWACNEFAADGTHPSGLGQQKVAQRLLDFFRTDPTARPWFVGS